MSDNHQDCVGCDYQPESLTPEIVTVLSEEQVPCIVNLEDDIDDIRPTGPALSPSAHRRAAAIRTLALVCACSLSVGSHYASYILSPLKSRLSREFGTNNTEFSLLISAFSLNSTWTPLVGGVLASRLGTTLTSIAATGIILLGQVVLLIGDIYEDVRLMTLGMFVFGLGISPLAVVQETIIVRYFKSHGLGVSMAFGLVAGKAASFISARTSYSLTKRFGPHAPFYVATSLATFSVVINLIYVWTSKWFIEGTGAELEATDIARVARDRETHNLSEAQALKKVADRRRVNLREITKLGDVFWAYVGLNVIFGTIWSPFTHLAANVLEIRYKLPERVATIQASYLLVGSIILYPIVGHLVDRYKHKSILIKFFLASSVSTLCCYAWLALPPTWTKTALPGIAAFGFGHGFSPLLLVVIVPQIVPLKYVSTALGVHKSLEQTGATIFQTFAGLTLDFKDKQNTQNGSSIQRLLNIFLFLNVLHLISVIGMFYLMRNQENTIEHARSNCCRRSSVAHSSPTIGANKPFDHQVWASTQLSQNFSIDSSSEEEQALLEPGTATLRYRAEYPEGCCSRSSRRLMKKMIRRGEIFTGLSAGGIAFAWVLFLGVAYMKLRSKHERDHQ